MTSDDEDDPLEGLLVEKDKINRQRLADALDGYVGIDSDSGEIIRFSDFHDLDSGRRITAILLGQKVAEILEIIDGQEVGLKSQEIANYVEVSESTVRHHSSDKPFIEQSRSQGGYYIPDVQLRNAINVFEPE